MEKSDAVASMGQHSLLLPVWVKTALAANDRLKLCLSILQEAYAHAMAPEQTPSDMRHEMAAAGLDAHWLRDLPTHASRDGEVAILPELPRLAEQLAQDLTLMARPVLASETDARTRERVAIWSGKLASLHDEELSAELLRSLTHGQRAKHGHDDTGLAGDSLHLLVMDLHKQLNHLAGSLASELIAGAHVWQLLDEDRPRVMAFMQGLQRTAGLKFDHPGLETAATRDGDRLLIQNDIGTNDAHVLVLQIHDLTVSLTYSDLHSARFAFFQAQLEPFGAQWSTPEARVSAGLNRGEAYQFGVARFETADEAALQAVLEGIASRIVFLIDWNRARKRLLNFVSKSGAVAVLSEAARLDLGHMAWLKAGAERLLFEAMQALGADAFRIGDRLDEVLGQSGAQSLLVEVLRLSSLALRQQQPIALVADETRLLLARQLQQRAPEFDLLAEHMAYCQALAESISQALDHGVVHEPSAALKLAQRAKGWERQADHLLISARERARRLPRWGQVVRLLEQSDDAADALEESAFVLSLIAEHHHRGWNRVLGELLSQLAQGVLHATQELVKAIAVARGLSGGSEAVEHDEFIAATWQVLRAERQCDELLRAAKRCMLAEVSDAATLMLTNDLANQLEQASDHLLNAAYTLRELVFNKTGVGF